MDKLIKHYCVPLDRWWIQNYKNTIIMNSEIDKSLRNVFWNKLPSEQIHRILEINSSVLTNDFKRDIMEILLKWHTYIYKKDVINKEKYEQIENKIISKKSEDEKD